MGMAPRQRGPTSGTALSCWGQCRSFGLQPPGDAPPEKRGLAGHLCSWHSHKNCETAAENQRYPQPGEGSPVTSGGVSGLHPLGTRSQILPVLCRPKFQVISAFLAKDEPPPLRRGSTCPRRPSSRGDFCGKGLGTSDCTDGQSQSLSGITQGTISSPPPSSSPSSPCMPALLPSLINYPSALRAPRRGGWGTTVRVLLQLPKGTAATLLLCLHPQNQTPPLGGTTDRKDG